MQTIKRAKAANPKLSAVFYLNTLYDFPFLELHGKALEANADIVDINGKLVAFKNDNGICLLYTSPSPRDATLSRMPSSA